MVRRQVEHLNKCQRRPNQFYFKTADDFQTLRSLRNPDGSWMPIYFHINRQHKSSFLTSASVMGLALGVIGRDLGVEEMSRWLAIEQGSLTLFRIGNQTRRAAAEDRVSMKSL